MKKQKNQSPESPAKQKPCAIKMLPQEYLIKAANKAVEINPMNSPARHQKRFSIAGIPLQPMHLAVMTSKYWGIKGVRLTVGFLDNPSNSLKKRILSHMNAWNKHCNVKFTITNTDPQVRISRSTPAPDDGYWSYLGTDILSIPKSEPTMNLDSFTMDTPESEFHRVVRHETGHTLGFPHEHMRAEIISKIDKDKAIALFMATQGWTREDVIAQVLTPIPQSALDSTATADPRSIMCYDLPSSIMKNGKAIPGGMDIDKMDAQFAALIYPKKKKK